MGVYFVIILFTCPAIKAQLPLTESNLPLFFIETNGDSIVADSSITADMGVIYNGYGKTNYITDPFNNYDDKISIKKRGSTSLAFPKASYRIETQDSTGQNNNVSLVDLPEENDWVLYGPYSDKTLMRNMLLYNLAEQLGWYGPRTRFCELFLNNDYRGVYVLIEKIKIDDERVDIANLTQNDTIGDELTGGYIVRIDRMEGGGWHSDINTNIYFSYYDPDEDELLEVQRNYIKDYINNFEYKLDSAINLMDTSLLALFDEDSFIDFIILNELSKNVDAYRLSTYMFKDKNSNDGRLRMGPVWDYNIAFGNNYNYEAYTPEDFIYDNPLWEPFAVFWFRKLMSFESFQLMVNSRWSELRNTSLHIDSIYSIIDSSYVFLSEAQARNFERWPILGVPIWPNYFVGDTYQEDVDFLKQWISSRLEWLDENFPALYTEIENESADVNSHHCKVFPNPFANRITIKYKNGDGKNLNFSVFDMFGREVFHSQINTLSSGQNEYHIDLSDKNLENGIYSYMIGDSNTILYQGKLIRIK